MVFEAAEPNIIFQSLEPLKVVSTSLWGSIVEASPCRSCVDKLGVDQQPTPLPLPPPPGLQASPSGAPVLKLEANSPPPQLLSPGAKAGAAQPWIGPDPMAALVLAEKPTAGGIGGGHSLNIDSPPQSPYHRTSGSAPMSPSMQLWKQVMGNVPDMGMISTEDALESLQNSAVSTFDVLPDFLEQPTSSLSVRASPTGATMLPTRIVPPTTPPMTTLSAEPGVKLSKTDKTEQELGPAAADAAVVAAATSMPGPLPSLGSAMHILGKCRPCMWVWSEDGCSHGATCRYCHLCRERTDKQKRRPCKGKRLYYNKLLNRIADELEQASPSKVMSQETIPEWEDVAELEVAVQKISPTCSNRDITKTFPSTSRDGCGWGSPTASV
jgi:hypothetical protein